MHPQSLWATLESYGSKLAQVESHWIRPLHSTYGEAETLRSSLLPINSSRRKGLYPSSQHGSWHRAGAQGTCAELFKWHTELKAEVELDANLEPLFSNAAVRMVEGPWLPSGLGSSALLGTRPSGRNQLQAPKDLSHGWGMPLFCTTPMLWLHLSKKTGKIVLSFPSTSSLFLVSFFSLLFPFFLKVENVSGMQNSIEESVMSITNTVKPQPHFKRKCYKSNRNLSPPFLLLSPFIPFSCFPSVSSFVYSRPSLPMSLPISSPNPLCPATFLDPFCITFLPPYPYPLFLFFSSSLVSSLAFFSPASLISACGSVTHSFGCSV